MLKSDKWIRKMCLEQKMIDPYVEKLQGDGKVSYGLSSYGYDIRVTDEFKIFTNVLGAVVDEANFFEDGVADEIHEGLRQRIRSRFGSKGLLIAISSPDHVDDFTERRLKGGGAVRPPRCLAAGHP